MVVLKLAVVLMVIAVGAAYVNTENWTPFLPYGFEGVLKGSAYIFFAYIGFDSVSTHAEEAKNPQRDVPIGIIVSLLLCTVLYILVAGVLTGMVPYHQIDIDAPSRAPLPPADCRSRCSSSRSARSSASRASSWSSS
jgi:APA family basic amino acid/polyamine antiporter